MTLNVLGLAERLRSPRGVISPLPLADLALVMVFFALAGSALLVAPGEEIGLPATSAQATSSLLADDVVTLRANGLVILGDEVVTAEAPLEELKEAFAAVGGEGRVLLLKADRETPLEIVLRVTEAARAAGYAHVQAATVEESRR